MLVKVSLAWLVMLLLSSSASSKSSTASTGFIFDWDLQACEATSLPDAAPRAGLKSPAWSPQLSWMSIPLARRAEGLRTTRLSRVQKAYQPWSGPSGFCHGCLFLCHHCKNNFSTLPPGWLLLPSSQNVWLSGMMICLQMLARVLPSQSRRSYSGTRTISH